MNTEISKRLYDEAINLIPGGVNSPVRAFSPYPFFIKEGTGSKIKDVDGNTYIDYCMAYGPLIFGHADPDIIEAVKSQLNKGTMFGIPTPFENELAKLIINAFPSIEMVRLVNSGAEATMSAIRLARGYTGRDYIIKFEGCYHGAHDSVLVKAGSGASTFGIPDSLGIPKELAKYTIILPYNDFDAVEKTFQKLGNDIAAVIVEPVVGNMGVVIPKEDYLQLLREMTKKYNALLIFDEIITGFRLALGGAQEYFKIIPDITTLGKIIGHGFCTGAYGGKKEIMELISPAGRIKPASINKEKSGKIYQAGTFSGNPISTLAGITAIKKLKKNPNIYKNLRNSCTDLTKKIKNLAENNKIDLIINQIESMWQIFFTKNNVFDYNSCKSADHKKFQNYYLEMHKNRIFIPPGNYETCFLSTEHNSDDIKKTVSVLEMVFKRIR
ncbi:MAG: glutamate-1-semialdehyde 2,1-aminomutase [Candidatus Helarchaeota archaeon]|nr:glutamate-1-semialdehyde 2,1-aminomutase [Candidatus Helarchaeota archaeon]